LRGTPGNAQCPAPRSQVVKPKPRELPVCLAAILHRASAVCLTRVEGPAEEMLVTRAPSFTPAVPCFRRLSYTSRGPSRRNARHTGALVHAFEGALFAWGAPTKSARVRRGARGEETPRRAARRTVWPHTELPDARCGPTPNTELPDVMCRPTPNMSPGRDRASGARCRRYIRCLRGGAVARLLAVVARA
jgi:hypothetical protein